MVVCFSGGYWWVVGYACFWFDGMGIFWVFVLVDGLWVLHGGCLVFACQFVFFGVAIMYVLTHGLFVCMMSGSGWF